MRYCNECAHKSQVNRPWKARHAYHDKHQVACAMKGSTNNIKQEHPADRWSTGIMNGNKKHYSTTIRANCHSFILYKSFQLL